MRKCLGPVRVRHTNYPLLLLLNRTILSAQSLYMYIYLKTGFGGGMKLFTLFMGFLSAACRRSVFLPQN